jgi:ABC-type transporter Mla MlaB component
MLSDEDLQKTTAENDMNLIADVPEDHDLEPDAVADIAESVIILDAALTIQNVFKLYEKLKKSYAMHDSIEINASQVSTIDTATLQLLTALKKEAVKQQKSVVMTEPSQRFIESAGLLGLLELLEIEAFVGKSSS